MPTSIMEGKAWLLPRITALAPDTVLDIGAGEGTYARLLRPALPLTRFTAVEVWEPYLTAYALCELYDTVIVADARHLALPRADVVILGDVLEHMTHVEAFALWQAARDVAALAVFASIPIIEAPQGAVNGNTHETHVDTWTHPLGLTLPGLTDSWAGHTIGCYRAAPTREAAS